jgi:hypothetical protein
MKCWGEKAANKENTVCSNKHLGQGMFRVLGCLLFEHIFHGGEITLNGALFA